MLTVGKHIDILHDHHMLTVRMLVFKYLSKHLGYLMVGVCHTGKHLLIHLCHTLGRIHQPFPIRVIPQSNENASDVFFNRFYIQSLTLPSRLGPK